MPIFLNWKKGPIFSPSHKFPVLRANLRTQKFFLGCSVQFYLIVCSVYFFSLEWVKWYLFSMWRFISFALLVYFVWSNFFSLQCILQLIALFFYNIILWNYFWKCCPLWATVKCCLLRLKKGLISVANTRALIIIFNNDVLNKLTYFHTKHFCSVVYFFFAKKQT